METVRQSTFNLVGLPVDTSLNLPPETQPGSFGTSEALSVSPILSTLFVFGSFSEGMVHYRKIEPHIEDKRPATVRGALFRMPSGIPVFHADGTQIISGHIVSLRSHETLLALLDEFHGVHRADPEKGLFFRTEIVVLLDAGGCESSFVYTINPRRLPRGASPIEDADWQKSLAVQPPLFQRLTERQRAYIQRLGSSSGREIVPIDLSLYRELMHLEVVVDKGRRLALSPLGQELYRMLS